MSYHAALIPEIVAFAPELAHIRRDVHAHPELGYEEFRTADVIARCLTAWGVPFERGLAGTGIVAHIQRGSARRSVGLRADMDALPMQEQNHFPHCSQHPGKMHACGHDGHVAMLLGAAHYLVQHGQFDGTVVLIFQPAEEGGGGARRMIVEGLLKRFPMDAIFGMHNWPGAPVGSFGLREGPMMASSNEFELIVRGRGAHAAQPHKAVDPVMVAVTLAQAWQSIVSRNVNPLESVALSITQIHAGSTTNVIPDEARMTGTVRAFSTAMIDLLETRMRTLAEGVAQGFDAEVMFTFSRNYPPLINHPQESAFAAQVLSEVVGAVHVNRNVEPTMGAEDFAYFLQTLPGCYVFIGNGDGAHRAEGHGLGPCNLHNPSYDFNDALLPLGASCWVRLAERFLGG